MDRNVREEVKNPRQNANCLSVLLFWWVRNVFVTGYKRELEENDLYSPLKEDKSDKLGNYIVKIWEQEVEKCKKKKKASTPGLFPVLGRCFGKSLAQVAVVLILVEFGLRLAQPFLFAELLRYITKGKDQWDTNIYYYATAFCILPVLDTLAMHWCLRNFIHIGVKIKVACATLIYRKILRLSNAVLENETSTGQMVNYLSNDINRLKYSVVDIHYVWVGPLQTVIITYLIYREIGWTAVCGAIIFLLFIPLQLFLGGLVSRYTLTSAERTDERLRLMNQIIAGLEIIKMYVWEVPYSLLVDKARRDEVNVIKKYSMVEQFSFSFHGYVPRLCLFLTILAYVLIGNTINAETVFMITAFYNILRNSMTTGFPISVHQIAEAIVSIRRLEKFMIHPEISKPETNTNQLATPEQPICLKNATAKWNNSKENNTLENINLTVEKGQLVAIVGQIGSGKSSLLEAILRELPLEKGVLETCGKISYANQRPWIFASSTRQNILFGQPMDETRYNETIRVCQLKQDIETFPHGDKTIVGERGINLSGGQKARINLARALYSDADIYLLDDPLSAVDPQVGSRIVEECICGFLKDKTRILVTHQLQYLKYADVIVVMNDGSVQAKGTFEELQNMNLDFMQIFKNVDEKKDVIETTKREKILQNDEKKINDNSETEPLEVAETRTYGKLTGSVFLSYFKASRSICLIALSVLLLGGSQAIGTGSDYFVAFWVNAETNSWVTTENGTERFEWNGPLPRDVIIYIYSAMTASVICFCILQTFSYYAMCMRSSKNLHADMFRSMIRATMYFYNTNPAGRILNRFSKDIGAIDHQLPFTLFDVMSSSLVLMGMIVIIGVVSPWLLIPTALTMLLFYYLRAIYIPTSRAVKRMEGTTQSPVFDHVGATLQGLTTIRAFKAENILSVEFDNHQDHHTSSWFIYVSVTQSFALYVELFCLIYVALITVIFLVFNDLAVAADIGLVITQIMSVTAILQWAMTQTAELETQMTSVERVLEYSRLEEEPFLESKPGKEPPKEWPREGRVEFKDVKLKYGPKGLHVLKGINFTIMSKEKVGVVGRTGAGKTSLISALFRLAYVEGEIIIDDVSTASIALRDFRSKISIIPQEPVLFGGSLRKNLDPFDEYTDSMLWDALQEVELKETISKMSAGLNTIVAEDGVNFSVGQRQLLCLVRALIRNNKVMVLDEATANVDPQTDSLIQKTVRRKFENCTVITVAHRLNTIMDSDKIIVMDQGCLVEFDHPHVLLEKKGFFYDMVQETGTAMANTLTQIAKENYHKKYDTPT